MKGVILILMMLLGGLQVQAQSRSAQQNAKLLQKAAEYYQLRDFSSAIQVYEQLEKRGSRTAIRKLADCYRQQYKFEEAEYYYAKSVEQTNIPPTCFFRYAQALMSNGKFEAAIPWLEKYAKLDPDTEISHMLARCRDAINSKQKLTEARVRPLPFNTEAAEFAPAFYQNGLLFTSSRLDGFGQRRDNYSDQGYLDVYFAPDPNGEAVEKMSGDINMANLHEGPAFSNANGDRIYFTRNNFEKGSVVISKSGNIKLKIYSGELDGTNVRNLTDLAFNGNEYACSDPTLSEDEQLMFFTSDHVSGYGGTDIWYSVYDTSRKRWSRSLNAGPLVNTEEDERFPFLHADGSLYFASNGHLGYGGLDVFRAQPMSGDTVAFTGIENLGYPINTERDDFGYITNESRSKTYFASNRAGGMGGDDIYSYGNSTTLISFAINHDGQAVEGARISIYDLDEDILLQSELTNKSGSFQGVIRPNTSYRITVVKEGFEMMERMLETGDSGETVRVKLDLKLSGS